MDPHTRWILETYSGKTRSATEEVLCPSYADQSRRIGSDLFTMSAAGAIIYSSGATPTSKSLADRYCAPACEVNIFFAG